MIEYFPCGCQMEVINGEFKYEPCSLDCEYYQYAIKELARQGKPLEYRSKHDD